MLLIHDVIEIDAGDTFAFDVAANADKAEREQRAADRIFRLLPDDLALTVRGRWEEFESGETPTARFANALDRFQGLILNDAAGDGGTWRLHRVTAAQVLARMDPIRNGAPALWPIVLHAVDLVVNGGDVRENAN